MLRIRSMDLMQPWAPAGRGCPGSHSWSGCCALALALTFQFYTTVLDWPLNVGGKPDNSTLAFVPICFELTVLLSGSRHRRRAISARPVVSGKKGIVIRGRCNQ